MGASISMGSSSSSSSSVTSAANNNNNNNKSRAASPPHTNSNSGGNGNGGLTQMEMLALQQMHEELDEEQGLRPEPPALTAYVLGLCQVGVGEC
jgi:hypothetical protein